MKILYIKNTPLHFRRPFFKILDKKYKVKFIFTHIGLRKEINKANNILDEIRELNYSLKREYFDFLPHHGAALGIINDLLTEDYDLTVDRLDYHTVFSYIISKLTDSPLIITFGDWEETISSLKMKMIQVYRQVLKESDAILAISKKAYNYLISVGVKKEKIFIMPQASDFTLLEDEDFSYQEKEKEKSNNYKKILYVGRLLKRKGVHYLIQAFSKLTKEMEKIKLIIVGNGKFEEKLISLTEKIGIENKVTFKGYIKHEKLPIYYQMSDIFVFPAIKGEPWGFTINESMNFGTPVISTDAVASAHDLIENGENGYIIQRKNSDLLYNFLKKLLLNNKLRKKLGKNSKETVKNNYNYEEMLNVFDTAIKYVFE
ncbi:hypothetical protein AKJ38_02625 [candidate division MSBL1 archaeon SCGC-AAA259I14]|uniref:Glycosyl transferase family 1 domain-containing protein n=1 Tax=candidate division MSBL1 archaeon SCGC-AAA259I14 TaxID=1698268 RepID=A0A133URA3_9EURY|nr:hypothetical protein AKJ38_02625 [candidate division MSBL1 archaeon SCGC-AAA259I14]